MDLVCLVSVALSIGAWFASAERHSVYWNSSNPHFLWDEYTVEVRINDYLDIICPHYAHGEVSSHAAERYVLYMVEKEDYEVCKPHSFDQLRWECSRPFAPHAPEKFSEKFQRFTPFTLGKEFRQGESYYYISKPMHHHGQDCLRLKDDPAVMEPKLQRSIGNSGTRLVSFPLFFAGILILSDMRKMQESKSTDNIQFLPFLTTCLNNLGWLYYGVLKSDQTIILVNVIGALLQILYIIMYLRYTKVKNLVGAQTLIAGIILLCGWLYFTVFLPKGETQLSQLGFTCSVVTVSMYLSPLSSLLEMVRSRNVQCLSFPLTVTTLLTSTSWVLYGLQVSDLYIVTWSPGVQMQTFSLRPLTFCAEALPSSAGHFVLGVLTSSHADVLIGAVVQGETKACLMVQQCE
ncbi:hypothetical protein fugu_010100 [Takifugu bimaculatus]|uniref:Ephrin-A1 n=1 Tax=Takifugu bimaculatus TaxID=433685 RepID=A0A4Z2CEE3_9TELE|nr:hypothetical protein fugu_010100 [Takifugu bimaculatus]